VTGLVMLDTNIVSHVMQGRDASLLARLTAQPVGTVVLSSVTLGELEYGIHRKGDAARLRDALNALLACSDVLPWDETVAKTYDEFAARLQSQGFNLSGPDMLIAAHAAHAKATLVSRDMAFGQLGDGFRIEVW
jgi:tRNA(fMet)-specific endonuclease VapC